MLTVSLSIELVALLCSTDNSHTAHWPMDTAQNTMIGAACESNCARSLLVFSWNIFCHRLATEAALVHLGIDVAKHSVQNIHYESRQAVLVGLCETRRPSDTTNTISALLTSRPVHDSHLHPPTVGRIALSQISQNPSFAIVQSHLIGL